jgi:hypothetical protein
MLAVLVNNNKSCPKTKLVIVTTALPIVVLSTSVTLIELSTTRFAGEDVYIIGVEFPVKTGASFTGYIVIEIVAGSES